MAPEFADYFAPGNGLNVRLTPIDGCKENFYLELFLFPNLSLSGAAIVELVYKHKSDLSAEVILFVDICSVPWDLVYNLKEYAITKRIEMTGCCKSNCLFMSRLNLIYVFRIQ